MYEDKILVCKECGKEFTFTAGEQEFYAERGFQNEPQRCKACRDARKNAARGPREYFTATCAACGGEARVPFEPKSDRPVYCSECFAKMREQQRCASSRADCQSMKKRAPSRASFFVPFRKRAGRPAVPAGFPRFLKISIEKPRNFGYTTLVTQDEWRRFP